MVQYPPPGRMVDIGGRRLHAQERGQGSPVVVLESGIAATSLSWQAIQKEIAGFTRVVSAHVMGGCGLAGSERLGVVRPDGQHWQLNNVSVHDGYLFPTSIGANPQLSIYGLVNKLATGLVKRLNGRDVTLA